MKKKVLASLLCVAMAATMVVGCGSSSDANAPADNATTDDAAKDDAAKDDAADDTAKDDAADTDTADAAGGDYHFELIVKAFSASYWQAAVTGAQQAADELGVTFNCTGPNSESDIADQVNMLNNAINVEGVDGIGIAASDQSACLDALQTAMDKKIPVVCFDSGIPDAPEGSVYSTITTDNYGAGVTAAENLYAGLKDKIAAATAPVRIGEVNQEAVSESVVNRGLGFLDKFAELAKADGKTVAIIGNDKYVNDTKAETVAEGDADIIIEVAVPAQATVELCATEASVIMNKSDTIGIFGSNQTAAEGLITANNNLNVLGSDPETSILGVGFDAGSVIKAAIKDGTLYGAITQSPLAMGITTIQTLYAIANGETVSDIPTEGYWYNADNMDDDSIAPNLYD